MYEVRHGRDELFSPHGRIRRERSVADKTAKGMSLEELKTAEYCESCSDDNYGQRLRELREELNRRRGK
jgi:hypothetical protein